MTTHTLNHLTIVFYSCHTISVCGGGIQFGNLEHFFFPSLLQHVFNSDFYSNLHSIFLRSISVCISLSISLSLSWWSISFLRYSRLIYNEPNTVNMVWKNQSTAEITRAAAGKEAAAAAAHCVIGLQRTQE